MADDDWTAAGIEVGGEAVSGAVVDLSSGSLVGRRVTRRLARPLTPGTATSLIAEVAAMLDRPGATGIAVPGTLNARAAIPAQADRRARNGCATPSVAADRLSEIGCRLDRTTALAIGETRYGAGMGRPGLLILVSFGAAVSVGLTDHGWPVPDSDPRWEAIAGVEPGPLLAGESGPPSWNQWGQQVRRYLSTLERLVRPELIILSAGTSVAPGMRVWMQLIGSRTPLAQASLGQNGVVIGAAAGAAGGMAGAAGGADVAVAGGSYDDVSTRTTTAARGASARIEAAF